MKKKFRAGVAAAVIVGLIVSYSPLLALQAKADISTWQKSVDVYPQSSTDFSSQNFKQSLQNLKADGANYVTLVIPYYQSDTGSSNIFAGNNTPTDQSLADASNYAHSIGLKVMFNIRVDTNSNAWRAFINPSGSTRTAWFANYSSMLNHLGDIAKTNSVEEMCIGTEMIDMTSYKVDGSNTQAWISMIQSLRTHFNGQITYDANWGDGDFATETTQIGFWSYLDFISISGYYELDADGSDSVASLMNSWTKWDNQNIQPLYNTYHKPILFTEVGYKSVAGAHGQPWNSDYQGSLSQQEQANDYQALFQYWNSKSYFAGVHLWTWYTNPNAGGANDSDYTPQNKQAEQIMKQYWLSNTSNPTNPSNPTTPQNPPASWNSSAVVTTQPVNQTSTFAISITPVTSVSDTIVDAEIYDSGNNKKYQQFFEHQNFSANQQGSYNLSWTPTATSNYTLKLGVFNSNWATNYYWNNSLTTFQISQTSTPVQPQQPVTPATTTPTQPQPPVTPPATTTPTTPTQPQQPTTYTTNIWWPGNGSTVTGVQPFKAQLSNNDVGNYTMYWQVDGGQLNSMANNNQDYPHKESDVDVSSWNWKGAGPYTLNFVSKDNSGTIISQASTAITISH